MVRSASLLILVALAPDGRAQDSRDPQVRLDLMHKALKSAKTLRVRVTADVTAGANESGDLKGEMVLGAGGRARIDLAGFLGLQEEFQLRCDGQRQQRDGGDIEKADGDWADIIRLTLRRSGAVLLMTMPKAKNADLEKAFKISALQFLAIKRDGKRTVYSCRYRIDLDGVAVDATLHLDDKTNLPLRRELRAVVDGEPSVVREAYEVEINPKLDDAIFQPVRPVRPEVGSPLRLVPAPPPPPGMSGP